MTIHDDIKAAEERSWSTQAVVDAWNREPRLARALKAAMELAEKVDLENYRVGLSKELLAALAAFREACE